MFSLVYIYVVLDCLVRGLDCGGRWSEHVVEVRQGVNSSSRHSMVVVVVMVVMMVERVCVCVCVFA